MSGHVPAHARFRARLLAGERLIGTFLKTPTGHATEMFGALGFDFVVIDQEHAPFDRASSDATLLAARGADIAALVRVPGPDAILSVLDCGATGVLVPHVSSAAMAREVAALCRYRNGKRGFAGDHAGRAATAPCRCGGISEAADAATTLVAQIEDPAALDEIEAIAAVEGIDSLFIGRGDLTAAYGDQSADPSGVRLATERIAAAARHAGKPISVFVGGLKEAAWLGSLGASAFILGSDHSFMKQAAAAGAKDIRGMA